uniref:Nucleic-acid-binding protein from transposon X-element n=1 Tax=Melanaphis sacchari TaxID=742174 RepID=A0A2H8TF72_9HEMI
MSRIKCCSPTIFVELFWNDNNKDVHNITSLLNTKVVVEKPHRKKYGPPQCHNCQSLGHTQNFCNHNSRCVKCGEDHHTESCTKDRNSPAKCALCSLDHTANYKGCQVFKSASKLKENKKTPPRVPPTTVPGSYPKSNTKTYAEATSNKNFHSEDISVSFSHFISNLNSIINPLISLLSSVLNALIAKGTISP